MVLKQIESKDDTKIVEAIGFQTRVFETLTEFNGNIDQILKDYQSYFDDYTSLRFMQISMNQVSQKLRELNLS